jgi:hypothetical protein
MQMLNCDEKDLRSDPALDRRSFLRAAGIVAAATLAGGLPRSAPADQKPEPRLSGRRKLGSLEVSSIGLGCMDMVGFYGTPPHRPEMLNLIRAAYNRGVTFFDTAEAYGPFEGERLLGEAVALVSAGLPRKSCQAGYIRLVDGKITRVEAVFTGPHAYMLGTGWPGGSKDEARPIGR